MIYYYMIRFDIICVLIYWSIDTNTNSLYLFHFNSRLMLFFSFFFKNFKDGTSRDEEDNSNNNKEVENSLEGDSEED